MEKKILFEHKLNIKQISNIFNKKKIHIFFFCQILKNILGGPHCEFGRKNG